MKNMLNFKEFTADELMDILNLALDMKKNPEKYSESLKGKKLYTLFEKTSTRTFLSFATGITELGGTYTTSYGRIPTLYLVNLFPRSNMSAVMLISSWHV